MRLLWPAGLPPSEPARPRLCRAAVVADLGRHRARMGAVVMDRAAELAAIAEFCAQKGVTRGKSPKSRLAKRLAVREERRASRELLRVEIREREEWSLERAPWPKMAFTDAEVTDGGMRLFVRSADACSFAGSTAAACASSRFAE